MKDAETFAVWVWLLGNATFDEKRVLFGGTERELQKGELVTTTKFIANELKINESKVNRVLKMLENEKQIEKQTTNRNTLIYIVNWGKYQSDEKQNEEQMKNEWKTNDEQMKNKRQTSEEQMATIQESNNDKELKKREESKKGTKEEIITMETESVTRPEMQTILDAWNDLQNYGIKPVLKLKSGTKRHSSLLARIKEYGVADVLSAIENIKRSDFLQGKNNRNWTITFDWLVLPNNFPKVLEGNYTNKESKPLNRNDINASRQSQLEYLLNSIREDEMNEQN